MPFPTVQSQPLKSEGYLAWIYQNQLRESFSVKCHPKIEILLDDRCQHYPSKRQIQHALQNLTYCPPVLTFNLDKHILFYVACQDQQGVQYVLRDTLEFSETTRILS